MISINTCVVAKTLQHRLLSLVNPFSKIKLKLHRQEAEASDIRSENPSNSHFLQTEGGGVFFTLLNLMCFFVEEKHETVQRSAAYHIGKT